MSNTTTVKKTRGRPSNKKASVAAKRPTRIPMSGSRLRMELPEDEKDPAYFYKWIGDNATGQLHRAKQAGFEHVTKDEFPSYGMIDVDSASSPDSIISMPGGDKITMYLMKQPIEFYNEDKAEMDALTDAREADMKKNLNSGMNGTYGKVDIN